MPEPLPQPKPEYRFENDVSGRMFCWLIEAGQLDWRALMDEALREDPKGEEVIPRFADALKRAVGGQDAVARLGPRPPPGQGPAAESRPLAPAYSIWFRPSPSKKIKFKEVAEALLTYAGWHSPQDQL
jgi:hypothetical protein